MKRLYFHGLPGGNTELSFVCKELDVISVDRLSLWCEKVDFRALADHVETLAKGDQVHLIGFSIGAMSAMRTASRLKDQVALLDLVSPCAPLQLGNFLPAMAGRPLFNSALRSERALQKMIWLQGTWMRFAPSSFMKLIFSGVSGDELALTRSKMFQDTIKTNFNYCFGEQRRPYQLEIQAYVENWAQELKDITAPSCIWHGDSDNWVPGKMSKLLSEELSQCKLNFIDNSGHYSCLQKYIAKTIE